LAEIFRIAAQISTPLALAGFLAAAFFQIVRLILSKNLKAQVRPTESALIVRQIIDRLFVLSLVAMLLGFAGWTIAAILRSHAEAVSDHNSPALPDDVKAEKPIAAKLPAPTLHDTDESGIRYNVTWSPDANCTKWNENVAAHPQLAGRSFMRLHSHSHEDW
jgi:predicted PurR-regulated permease PerM